MRARSFVLVVLGLAGCGGPPLSAPDAHSVDAGPDPEPPLDAGLLPDGGLALDAGATDTGAPDGGAPDTVAVRVWNAGVAHEHAIVVLHDAEGVPRAIDLTDSDGIATFRVTEGPVMITTRTASGALRTRMDVQPGDTLCIGDPRDRSRHTVRVALPLVPPAGASTLEITTSDGCGMVRVEPGAIAADVEACAPSGVFHVLATARDASDVAIAHASALDQERTATFVALPSWTTDLVPLDVQVTGATAPWVHASAQRGGASLLLGAWDGLAAQAPVPDLGSFVSIGLRDGTRSLARITATVPGSLALDGDRDLLPAVVIASAVAGDDPARPHVAWDLARPADLDLVQVMLGGRSRWLIDGSGDRRALRYPELPELLADARPTADVPTVTVTVYDRTWLDSEQTRSRCPVEPAPDIDGVFRASEATAALTE